MSKFLEGRNRKPSEVYKDEDLLTTGGLRSLVPGNYVLIELYPGFSKSLAGITPCFLMLHEKGLFVLEQCRQNGIIHGEEREASWTSYNYLGDGTPFENPLVKNNLNVQALAAVLKLPVDAFHSCLVFDSACEIRRVPANSPRLSIICADQLEEHFAKLLPSLPVCYTHTQLTALHDIFVLVTAEAGQNAG